MCTAGLELRPVTSLSDVMYMRDIRNECRSFMTNDTSYIGWPRQFRWWRKVKSDPEWSLYLLWYNGSPIGYGIIRLKNHMRWVSGGIISQSRGHGFGRCLFSKLTDIATDKHAAYLEVLESNTRAITLYRSLGYRYIGNRDKDTLLMRADPV